MSKVYFTKLIILILPAIFFSCNKNVSKIPDVYVNFSIDINKTEYIDLRTIGSHIYVKGGVEGIIIFRKSYDEFTAYERACPYDPNCGRVTVSEGGYEAIDTICCNSEYSLLISGAVTKGPSEYPLKFYTTSFNSTSGILRVSN